MLNIDQGIWTIIISSVSAMVAIVAAFFANSSNVTARKALAIAEQQEVRKRPALTPYLIEGYFKKIEEAKTKIYGFSISLSNPTDIDNSIAHLELEICYVTVQNVCMKLKIPHRDNLVHEFGGGSIKPLVVPLPVLAHQTVAGWALFNVSNALLGDCEIDSYSISITDAHGVINRVEPYLVKEFANV